MGNEYDRVDEAEQARLGRTVGGRYAREESIEAEAYREREKNRKIRDAESIGDFVSAEEALITDHIRRAQGERAQEVIRSRQQTVRARAEKSRVQRKRRGAITRMARWTGIGIATTLYIYSFACAVASFIGFYFQAVVMYTSTETLLGRSISFFIDIQSVFPVEYIGIGFWGVATLINMCTFIGFLLWFHLTGISIFRSTISLIITFACFSASLIPGANLFPWLIIWIVYMNMSDTAQLFSPLGSR